MNVDELVGRYPRLYHMAHRDSWEGIQRHGLLSTTALLDRFQVGGAERAAIESSRRPASVWLRHPDHGRAVVRDNLPMTEAALVRCLQPPMTPTDWYELLNHQVFFWPTAERVERLLAARAYRTSAHLVLTIDTGSLVAAHLAAVRLSPINSGSTAYNPVARGATTFQTIADYPYGERRKIRGASGAIAELTVDYAVPDICDHVVEVARRAPGEPPERIA